MKVIVLLAALVASAYAADGWSQAMTMQDRLKYFGVGRIINGQSAVYEQFPWQVAVEGRTSAGTSFCGGSLISDRWILTAAHCAQGKTSFTIRLGGLTIASQESGRLDLTSTEFTVHPGYNANLNNDVAVIRLPEAVTFSDRIRAVRLPSRGEIVGASVPVTVSGWGKTSDAGGVSQTLNYVDVNTISNAECAAIFGNQVIIASTVCIKGNPNHGTCNGDSGGPLVQYSNGVATQVGVVSFGTSLGCVNSYPNGFVRTEAMLSWIAQTTGLDV